MYVDALLEREKNTILVVERDAQGRRQFMTYPTKYVVCWPSQRGKATSIYGKTCDKFTTNKTKEFQREVNMLSKHDLHEADINPIFRCFIKLSIQKSIKKKTNL